MPGRDAFVAEVPVYLEHPFEAAHHQALQVELGRDAQEQLHVEGIVMGRERPRVRATRDRVHHRRLDFQVAAVEQELPHRLHGARAREEGPARILVHHQVEIALPVTLLLVGQAMEFFRQRAQRLGQQADGRHAHREFAGLGAEQHAGCADDVAKVVVLECLVRLGAGAIVGHV